MYFAPDALFYEIHLWLVNGRLSSSVSGNEAEDVAVPVPNSPANLEKASYHRVLTLVDSIEHIHRL